MRKTRTFFLCSRNGRRCVLTASLTGLTPARGAPSQWTQMTSQAPSPHERPEAGSGSSRRRLICRRSTSRSSSPETARYLLPDLPHANYTVWVRGYGLVDSLNSTRGRQDLESDGGRGPEREGGRRILPGEITGRAAGAAPETSSPAGEWRRPATAFHQHQDAGRVAGQHENDVGCTQCHQWGNKATRHSRPTSPHSRTRSKAWDYRVNVGVTAR